MQKQSGEFAEISGIYGFVFDKRNRTFMPTDGSILSFNQSFPFYADKSFISNSFAYSTYKTINENVVGAGKFYLNAINGLGDDDVRLSKELDLAQKG